MVYEGVREPEDLGIGESKLDRCGLPAREWALVGLSGQEIYSEARGKFAGYGWHQYAGHRGQFHLLLARLVIERLGPDRHCVVLYPISHPDADGLAEINWIAEQTFDTDHDWQKSGWFRPVALDAFAHEFDGFVYDWLDLPALLAKSECAYENPMIDREPLDSWVDGPVAPIGDAAHAMYPTGSNGATQAIIDARVLGRIMLDHEPTPAALKAFDDELCAPVGQLVLRNRGAGPFGLLRMVDDRCGARFDNIDDVIPEAERAAFMLAYQQAAGFAKERLNQAPRTIPEGARVARVPA